MFPFPSPLLMGGSKKVNTAEPGDIVFAPGALQNWTVPEGVYEIAILCVGPGGNSANETYISPGKGGDGGDLRWINNVPVQPGEVLKVYVDPVSTVHGGYAPSSCVKRQNDTVIVLAHGGNGARPGYVNPNPSFPAVLGLQSDGSFAGGGEGGLGVAASTTNNAGGGGGAGGYSGNGGNGSGSNTATNTAGSGGAGAGGKGGTSAACSGGGVDIYGEGASGYWNDASVPASTTGGSGGGASVICTSTVTSGAHYGSGGGSYNISNSTTYFQKGGDGAVRILWGKGKNNGGRAFPSTKVQTSSGRNPIEFVSANYISATGALLAVNALPGDLLVVVVGEDTTTISAVPADFTLAASGSGIGTSSSRALLVAWKVCTVANETIPSTAFLPRYNAMVYTFRNAKLGNITLNSPAGTAAPTSTTFYFDEVAVRDVDSWVACAGYGQAITSVGSSGMVKAAASTVSPYPAMGAITTGPLSSYPGAAASFPARTMSGTAAMMRLTATIEIQTKDA